MTTAHAFIGGIIVAAAAAYAVLGAWHAADRKAYEAEIGKHRAEAAAHELRAQEADQRAAKAEAEAAGHASRAEELAHRVNTDAEALRQALGRVEEAKVTPAQIKHTPKAVVDRLKSLEGALIASRNYAADLERELAEQKNRAAALEEAITALHDERDALRLEVQDEVAEAKTAEERVEKLERRANWGLRLGLGGGAVLAVVVAVLAR